MTVRALFAAVALLAAPVAMASDASTQPGADTATTTANPTVRTPQAGRKSDRARPMPLKPRVIEAPGAAVMVIPASYEPEPVGPFGEF